ncbi:class I SAM-dependent methyltransferase [Sphingomonas oligophenolica]|uniref:class I SAM-dependent methyltransferase n=1 Tax=Sphingomonas oligophenolica TaxID=301154 RepID=UPI0031D3E64F
MESTVATPLQGYDADEGESHSHAYLFPILLRILAEHPVGRIFELGCGNGTTAAMLQARGYSIIGVDPSVSGIEIAHREFPQCRLESGSSDEDLRARFGTFETVVSLEVAEHVYSPKLYAKAIFDLLEPGGIAIVSTPYHSYLKNLALAVSGRMESHFTALWEGGHIKFWSRKTLRTLFDDAGMDEIAFYRVGRVPVLAKSMVSVFRKREAPQTGA